MFKAIIILLAFLSILSGLWVVLENTGKLSPLLVKANSAIPPKKRHLLPQWLIEHIDEAIEGEEDDVETGRTTMLDIGAAMRMSKGYNDGHTAAQDFDKFFHDRTAAILQRYGKTNPARVRRELTHHIGDDLEVHWTWIERIQTEWSSSVSGLPLNEAEWNQLRLVYERNERRLELPKADPSATIEHGSGHGQEVRNQATTADLAAMTRTIPGQPAEESTGDTQLGGLKAITKDPFAIPSDAVQVVSSASDDGS